MNNKEETYLEKKLVKEVVCLPSDTNEKSLFCLLLHPI